MEITNKGKAEEDQQERLERSSIDDWEEYAKLLKIGAERRAEKNKRAKVGHDVEGDVTMEAIGAIGFNESDLKHNEAVEKFINQLCEETFGEIFDAIS